MPAAAHSNTALVDYQLRLPTFEGPLDVLLRLIEREQLPISQVSLVAVLDQFIAFVSALDAAPPEVIAEFSAVAARLSLLKSRALLPAPALDPDLGEPIDLVRQLEEYRALKAAALALAERHRSGLGSFAPGDGIAAPRPEPPTLSPLPRSTLARAVGRWLARLPQPATPFTAVRVVSLREMISRIFTFVEDGPSTTFQQISETCTHRQDVIVAFLAVLSLMRRQVISARQDTRFGTIELQRQGPRDVAVQHSTLTHSEEMHGFDVQRSA